ncbi:hypothetical protein [Altererythrobacter sp.]|uniref:hypothetical protein n=1 Tax=Altererythrobacter sp. TaxID=1872480 RepID=UPI003CFC4CDE
MKKMICYSVGAAIAFTPIGALAETPSDVDDLIGARGRSFDPEMGSRGYEFVKKEGEAQYWWNSHTKTCVAATIANGRVDTLNTQGKSKCGHGGSSAAGIVAGAAAVGLIAALTHHHKHDDSRNTSEYNTEYERGYNDGMYGSHYSKHDSEAYHSGYMAGETERNNRKHSNSVLVRGAPAEAQNACKERGDEYWGVPSGSTVPVSVFKYDNGPYEITVASGHRRASCTVNRHGQVSGFAE